MSIIGVQLDKENPEFSVLDFTFWMPQFKAYCDTDDGYFMFNKLYNLANNKVFYSIFGSDWEMAMSLVIAHYMTLIANQMQAPAGNTLQGIAGGGAYKGLVSSASVGGFSKSYDLNATLVSTDDAKFWNQTSYGAQYMALYKTKSIPSIFVVTSNNISRGGC